MDFRGVCAYVMGLIEWNGVRPGKGSLGHGKSPEKYIRRTRRCSIDAFYGSVESNKGFWSLKILQRSFPSPPYLPSLTPDTQTDSRDFETYPQSRARSFSGLSSTTQFNVAALWSVFPYPLPSPSSLRHPFIRFHLGWGTVDRSTLHVSLWIEGS